MTGDTLVPGFPQPLPSRGARAPDGALRHLLVRSSFMGGERFELSTQILDPEVRGLRAGEDVAIVSEPSLRATGVDARGGFFLAAVGRGTADVYRLVEVSLDGRLTVGEQSLPAAPALFQEALLGARDREGRVLAASSRRIYDLPRAGAARLLLDATEEAGTQLGVRGVGGGLRTVRIRSDGSDSEVQFGEVVGTEAVFDAAQPLTGEPQVRLPWLTSAGTMLFVSGSRALGTPESLERLSPDEPPFRHSAEAAWFFGDESAGVVAALNRAGELVAVDLGEPAGEARLLPLPAPDGLTEYTTVADAGGGRFFVFGGAADAGSGEAGTAVVLVDCRLSAP